jgi:lysyl endopeptidase
VNVNCETGSEKELLQRAVIRIIAKGEIGTATLINPIEGSNDKPYIISAYHIYDKGSSTYSLESIAEETLYDFNYESPFCTDINGYDLQSISGSVIRAAFDSLDFILVELSEVPPPTFRPYYAGFDASGAVPSNSFAIHHPNGDVKMITQDDGICDSLSYANSYLKFGHWKVLNWESGTTESGSSGSSLIGAGNRIFGTLTGGAASCTNISYDAFARLDKMWNYKSDTDKQLSAWLDPNSTGKRTNDGYDPYLAENKSCTLISNFY